MDVHRHLKEALKLLEKDPEKVVQELKPLVLPEKQTLLKAIRENPDEARRRLENLLRLSDEIAFVNSPGFPRELAEVVEKREPRELELLVSEKVLRVMGRLGLPYRQEEGKLLPAEAHWEKGVVYEGRTYWVPLERMEEVRRLSKEREKLLARLNLLVTRVRVGLASEEEEREAREVEKAFLEASARLRKFLEEAENS